MKIELHAETMRRLRFIYWFMFFAFLVFLVGAIALADLSAFNWLPDTIGFILVVASAVFLIGASAGTQSMAGSLFARKEILADPVKLTETFQSWFMIRMAMAEMAGLMAAAGYLITTNLMLLIIALLVALAMLGFKPSAEKAAAIIRRAQQQSSGK